MPIQFTVVNGDTSSAMAQAMQVPGAKLILVTKETVYAFKGHKEFSAHQRLWDHEKHVAFRVRDLVSARYERD
jgi:hypothetical protein